MRVEFNSVEIHGFLSIGDAKVKLTNQGIVKVTGINNSPGEEQSNGSGKSSIMEAVYFVFTGKTIRNNTDIVNIYHDSGYAEVKIDLLADDDHYVITRTKSHPDYGNNLFIIKNDKDISGDKLKKTEEILSTELPQVKGDVLTSVVILAQGLPNKFSGLTPLKRKERLEELAETSQFINSFRANVKSLTNDYTLKLTDCKVSRASVSSRIDTNKDSIQKKSHDLLNYKSSDETIESMRVRLSDYKSRLSSLEKEKEVLSDKVSSLSQKRSDMKDEYNKEYEFTIQSLRSEGSSLYEKKESLIKSKVCPTCGRPYDETTIQRIDSNVKEIDELMTSKLSKLSRLNDQKLIKLDEINSVSSQIDNLKSELNKIPSMIGLVNDISELNNSISKYEVATSGLSDEIKELEANVEVDKKKLKDIDNDATKVESKINVLSYLNRISNKEFRSYMLSGVVSYLNEKISSYGESLFGTNKLNLSLDSKGRLFITYEGRQYESLSGGEKQKADLATQFSIRDLLMYGLGFSCNLLVLDESFDNLDQSGTSSLLALITDIKTADSIFVVSHHAELSIPYDTEITAVRGIDRITEVKSSEV